MIWPITFFAAFVALIAYSGRGRNSVWGTATIGLVIGVVLALIFPGHFWWTLVRAVAVGALVGLVFDLLPRLVPRSHR